MSVAGLSQYSVVSQSASIAPRMPALSPVDAVRDVVTHLKQLTVTGDSDRLLESIAVARQALSSNGDTVRSTQLLAALQSTERILIEFVPQNDLPSIVRQRDILNPGLRARWIEGELDRAFSREPGVVPRDELRMLRKLFEENIHGVPLLWELRTITMRDEANAAWANMLQLAPNCT